MRLVATMLVRDSNMTIENSTQKIETFVNDAYTIEYNLANVRNGIIFYISNCMVIENYGITWY